MCRLSLLVAAVCLAPTSVRAGELPRAEPSDVGLSPEKLQELKPALEKLVEGGEIAGGVALVARHGKVAFVAPFGRRDLDSPEPMTEDTIFAIASMTKPMTCVAVMTLVEAGKLGLDDPVGDHLPEMKELRVIGDAQADAGDEVATVPSGRPVTIRDLLSHTSGFAYGGVLANDPRLRRVYDRAGVQGRGLKTIAEQAERLAQVPLAHQPGARWTYGLGHDILGRLVEVVSGQPFDAYLRQRIFDPLDLHDTSFEVPEAKRDRVATIYRAALLGGKLTPLPRSFGSKTFFSGGGGLFSTARDYARFAQMLLNGGELDGVRILKPETIALMTSNQIGDHTAFVLFKYGLGFGLEYGPKGALVRYFWGGFYSTNFWVDPRNDVVAVILTQVLPTNHGGAEGIFRRTVFRSITDAPGTGTRPATPLPAATGRGSAPGH